MKGERVQGELGSIKETVDLQPPEVLDRAETFLRGQGYEVARRTDDSVTLRRSPRSNPSSEKLYLTVFASSQDGGTRVSVRGNDADGVSGRKEQWTEWSESLPKKTTGTVESDRPRDSLSPNIAETNRSERLTTQDNGGGTTYEYMMVQIPPTLVVQQAQHRGDEAANFLQNIANERALEGWEFHRIDSFTVNVQPGCLGALFGGAGAQQTQQHYVVSFRRPRIGALANR